MSSDVVADKFASLRGTIAWMDLVMANVNESIVVLDTDWRIIFANSFLAEILDQDRIMLLGKSFWDVIPLVRETANRKEPVDSAKLPITSFAKLNGIYEFKYKRITRMMSLQGRYVPALDQAVCIMSDVSAELQAENAVMRLQEEVVQLKRQVARLRVSQAGRK